MTRKVTPSVRAKIGQWEGLRLKAYQDSVGVWTIGYGHTRGVKQGDAITKAQADLLLTGDLAGAERAVERLVKVPLNDNQFGALVSFVFNVGEGAFAGSTLLKRLNAGDYNMVPIQLARWNKGTINGRKVVIAGLTNRRAAEAGLWVMGAFVASQDVEPVEQKPVIATPAVAGAASTGVGVVGSSLTEAASQTQLMIDYGDVFKIMFVLLMAGGIAFTIYDRLRLRRQDGV